MCALFRTRAPGPACAAEIERHARRQRVEADAAAIDVGERWTLPLRSVNQDGRMASREWGIPAREARGKPSGTSFS